MEGILVCLSGAPSNVRVIQAAAKMAEAYGGNLTALYVVPPDFHEHDSGAKSRLEENFRLAHRLGAKVTRLYGDDAATQIAGYARVSGSTKIVIAKSPTRTSFFGKKVLIDRLNELAPDVDIFIIPDKATPSERAHRLSFPDEKFSVPEYSLSAEPSEIATFVVMFIAAIIISSLTTQVKRQARRTAAKFPFPMPSCTVWGNSTASDMQSLRVYMATLRKKLGKNTSESKYIQTHIGVGYRMLRNQ